MIELAFWILLVFGGFWGIELPDSLFFRDQRRVSSVLVELEASDGPPSLSLLAPGSPI